MKNQINFVLPAASGTYLVTAQSESLASYDPILAYRVSDVWRCEIGQRVAILASGDEVELADDYESPRNFGVMDSTGKVCSRGLLFDDALSFCESVFAHRQT